MNDELTIVAIHLRAIAYTNSVAGATTTTLYDIDVANDILIRQDPANAGTLVTVGSLGVDLNTGLFGTFTDFDISGSTGTAYLTDGVFGGASSLYTVNLATGAANLQGTITGLGDRTIASIAVGPVVPEPTTLAMGAIAVVGLIASQRTRRD